MTDVREAVERLEDMAEWLGFPERGEGSTMLTASVAREHAADLRTVLDALSPSPEAGFWAARIQEVREESDGFWAACSGCQESVDGHVSTRDYPYSAAFGCQPGGGCRECGGLGVIWDTTDYDEMARSILADMEAESPPEGMVLVPREPTEAMLDAARYYWGPWLDEAKTERAGRRSEDPANVERARAVWEQMVEAALLSASPKDQGPSPAPTEAPDHIPDTGKMVGEAGAPVAWRWQWPGQYTWGYADYNLHPDAMFVEPLFNHLQVARLKAERDEAVALLGRLGKAPMVPASLVGDVAAFLSRMERPK